MIQVASIMTVWNQMQTAYVAHMWNKAFTKRLGTKFCSTFVRIGHVLRVIILNIKSGEWAGWVTGQIDLDKQQFYYKKWVVMGLDKQQYFEQRLASLLATNNKYVKLIDFGLAKEETVTEMITTETGTYRWMVPEVCYF